MSASIIIIIIIIIGIFVVVSSLLVISVSLYLQSCSYLPVLYQSVWVSSVSICHTARI